MIVPNTQGRDTSAWATLTVNVVKPQALILFIPTKAERDGSSGYVENPVLYNIEIHYDRIGCRLCTEAEWEFAYRSYTITDHYWGDNYVTNYPVTSADSAFDTSHSYKGVWHLDENPAAGAHSIKDRTANGHHGTPGGDMDARALSEGTIGKGLHFDGINDHIIIGDVDLAETYMLSVWVNADSLGIPNRFIWKQNAYTLWYDIGGPGGIRCEHHSGTEWRGIAQDSGFAPPMTAGSWYILCGTYDGDKVRIYVNGELQSVTRSIGVNPQNNNEELSLSRITEYVHGTMDEVRIETAARRPASWIKLRYETEKPGSEAVRIAE